MSLLRLLILVWTLFIVVIDCSAGDHGIKSWNPSPSSPLKPTPQNDCKDKIKLGVITKERQLKLQPIIDQEQSPEAIPEILIKPSDSNDVIRLKFITKSTDLQLEQSIRSSSKNNYEHQQQQIHEPPIHLKQVITKPIHQNVHEIIVPTKTIIKEIRPLQQFVKTIVASSAGGHSNDRDHGHHDQQQQYETSKTSQILEDDQQHQQQQITADPNQQYISINK